MAYGRNMEKHGLLQDLFVEKRIMGRSKHSSGIRIKRMRSCLLIFFGISFAVGTFMSSRILLERKAADNAYVSLRMNSQTAAITTNIDSDRTGGSGTEQTSTADDPKETKPDGAEVADTELEPVPRVSLDFESLQEQCPDIRAWIFAEGTNVDYPVVQTDNNDFYLTHLYNSESNASGALFLDCRNNGLFMDQNTVIYGHHMRNGSMFGSLELYKGQDFYDEYPVMLLYTPDGDYLVELICGTVEDGNYEFVQFRFEDEDDFCSYIESHRSRSTFRSNVEIEPKDRIISLCTCSYEWDNARYMLIGKLTPIMEDPTR